MESNDYLRLIEKLKRIEALSGQPLPAATTMEAADGFQ
jgi:hypothetical protein